MRRGTSLMEVLVAIMVMSIGILGVMALFPIAIARSVEAHRLTNGRMLAERADTIVRARNLLSEDVVPVPAPAQFVPVAGTAPDGTTHAVIDPLGWHDMATSEFPQFAREYGNDGTAPVRYRKVRMAGGNRVAAPPPQFPQFATFGAAQDITLPNGLAMPDVADNGRGVPLRRISMALPALGNLGSSGDAGDPVGPYPPLMSPLFAPADRRAILEEVSLPDQFQTLFSGTPDSNTLVEVRFDAARNDLEHVQTPRLSLGTRVTLFGDAGRKSQVREHPSDNVDVSLSAGEWVVRWEPPLPLDFGPCNEVQIDFPTYRYTWMLTVRKRGVKRGHETEVDCVVFDKRPTGDPSQELVLPATQPDPNYGDPRRTDDDGNRISPIDLVDIEFTNKTFKRGGWVFDPQHCRWYRIADIIDETDSTARLQLAHNAHEWIRALIIPEGVIEVFPIDMRENVHTR